MRGYRPWVSFDPAAIRRWRRPRWIEGMGGCQDMNMVVGPRREAQRRCGLMREPQRGEPGKGDDPRSGISDGENAPADYTEVNAPDLARRMEDAGAATVTLLTDTTKSLRLVGSGTSSAVASDCLFRFSAAATAEPSQLVIDSTAGPWPACR